MTLREKHSRRNREKKISGREGREPPGTHLIIDWQCEIYEAEHGTSTVKAHQPVGNRLNRNRPASTEKDQEGGSETRQRPRTGRVGLRVGRMESVGAVGMVQRDGPKFGALAEVSWVWS